MGFEREFWSWASGHLGSYLGGAAGVAITCFAGNFTFFLGGFSPLQKAISGEPDKAPTPWRPGTSHFAIFFDTLIKNRIRVKIGPEVERLARRYGWPDIERVIVREVQSEITLHNVDLRSGHEIIERVGKLRDDPNRKNAMNNKYLALQEAVGACPFAQLRDALEAVNRKS
jgi:hypothetical protein